MPTPIGALAGPLHCIVLCVCAVQFACAANYGYLWLLFGVCYAYLLRKLDGTSQLPTTGPEIR
ncbi:hypothetical protein B0H11DRAFT_2265664 [Mycena galericulata]|nr:hypothetical protein B0H11DRAFT_2265664 [Mycena galericulata]